MGWEMKGSVQGFLNLMVLVLAALYVKNSFSEIVSSDWSLAVPLHRLVEVGYVSYGLALVSLIVTGLVAAALLRCHGEQVTAGLRLEKGPWFVTVAVFWFGVLLASALPDLERIYVYLAAWGAWVIGLVPYALKIVEAYGWRLFKDAPQIAVQDIFLTAVLLGIAASVDLFAPTADGIHILDLLTGAIVFWGARWIAQCRPSFNI